MALVTVRVPAIHSYVIATPAFTPAQSADTDRLLSPRKSFEDKDKDLKIGPRGQGLSSRTTTLVYLGQLKLYSTVKWLKIPPYRKRFSALPDEMLMLVSQF